EEAPASRATNDRWARSLLRKQSGEGTGACIMRGFRIGRAFGVDVRVDWSWVFIFLLLTWNLTAVFATWHPNWSMPGQLGVALVASLLFFGCILLHEIAHAVVAKRIGVSVRSITLFPFGGVSNVEHEPRSAGGELAMAIVGPLTSIVLGIAFVLLGSAAIGSSVDAVYAGIDGWVIMERLSPLATLLMWLGPINILIGLFNLIPAFPLDGGRVLRSAVWAITHDYRAATLSASAVGQVIGWLFIVAGIAMSFGLVLPVFGTGFVAGLWLAFIGWFIRSAAAEAYTRLAIDDALAGHTVGELMRRDGASVRPELPLDVLVHDYLVRSDEHAVPVVRDGTLLGLVSISEVRSVPAADWPTQTVGAVMRPTTSLIVATTDEPLSDAFQRMAREDIEQMPVLEGQKLAGVLRRHDVARWLELAWQPSVGEGKGSRPVPPQGLASRTV
ncbi:MAG: site-2 protease family protein, partial [Polyangiaceae bacterium]